MGHTRYEGSDHQCHGGKTSQVLEHTHNHDGTKHQHEDLPCTFCSFAERKNYGEYKSPSCIAKQNDEILTPESGRVQMMDKVEMFFLNQ
jgi:hypothetical protein